VRNACHLLDTVQRPIRAREGLHEVVGGGARQGVAAAYGAAEGVVLPDDGNDGGQEQEVVA
jgi:hypothetical protein